MTHSELIEAAARWLRGSQRCGVVLVEASGGHEIPDAIGWRMGGRMSVLVECKASRADFLRDGDKWHRRAGLGVGQRRYYMAPAGLLQPEDVPAGWGLVEVTSSGRCRVAVRLPKLETFDPEVWRRELGMLYSGLWKVQNLPPKALPTASVDGEA